VQVGFAREALFSQHEQAFISDQQVNARREPATTWNKPLRDFACLLSGAEHADDDAFGRLDQRDPAFARFARMEGFGRPCMMGRGFGAA
jgi:hypothetical protein